MNNCNHTGHGVCYKQRVYNLKHEMSRKRKQYKLKQTKVVFECNSAHSQVARTAN